MGHTWEFSSKIWTACTFLRNLTLLIIIMSSVKCDGEPCSNSNVDLRIECSIGRTVFTRDLCTCAAKSSYLRKLAIIGNVNLKRLPEGLLENLTGLKKLEIKKNHNLKELPEEQLENLTNLEVLDLQQNSLSVAPNVDYLTNLLELTLAYNPIQILPNDYLKSNTNLTLFKATGIGLTEVPHYLFKTTTQLKYLHLDDNQITTLTKDIFQNLDSLLALNLARNSLSSLSVTIFKDLGSLSYLDLSRNKLSTIVETLYPIRSNLKELKLSSNRLEMFELSKNFPFNEIRLLDLSKNNISRFDAAAALSQNLTRLYLDNNNLSGVSEEVIGYLKHNVKTGVKLGGNKFACNCRSLKLIEFLNEHIYKVLDIQDVNFDCNPSEPFSEFRTEDRVCPNLGRSVNRIYLILGFLLLCAVLIGLMDRLRLKSKKEPGNLETKVPSNNPGEASPQPHQFVSIQNSMTETVSADYLYAEDEPLDDMGSVDDVWGGHPQFLPVSGENSVAETVSADFDLDEDIEYEELVPGGGYPFPWHVRRQNSTTETFSADYLSSEDEPREGFLQSQLVSEQNSTETASADYFSAENEDLDHVPGGGHPQFSQNGVAETVSADYVLGEDEDGEELMLGGGNPLPHRVRRQNSTTETVSVDYLTAEDEPLDSDEAVGTGAPILQQLRTSSDPQENTVDENMDGSFLYDAFISYANEDERWVMVSERRMMISQTYNSFINSTRSSGGSNASDDTNKKDQHPQKYEYENMTLVSYILKADVLDVRTPQKIQIFRRKIV